MPLIKSSSKKAFNHNVEAEMKSGKPQSQSLAIAYDMKNRNKKKKMASGGEILSAASEKRPSPKDVHNDKMEKSENSSDKPLKQSDWTDRPDKVSQNKPKMHPLKHPKMVPSQAFSTRVYNKDNELEDPSEEEYMAQHFAEGTKNGGVQPASSSSSSSSNPLVKMADSIDKLIGNTPENTKKRYDSTLGGKAEGGEVDLVQGQPEDEEHEEHHASIADAIMAKRAKMHDVIDSGALDEDHAESFANGGEVDDDQADVVANNQMEHPNRYYKANEEEALDWVAGDDMPDQPEDSNLHAEEIDSDKHDMVSKIRRAMKAKRQP